MRILQWRILSTYLNDIPVPSYIHGFEKGKSIPVMAQTHTKKRCVISLDIKSFFPSIRQAHLQTLFANLGFEKVPAWILSEICTYKSFVPQGALTSPKISCLVTGGTFGPPIAKYCQENGLDLTIYADDITMSYSKEFESKDLENQFIRATIGFVKETLASFGFTLNREKTKVMKPYSRQWVCGAVVNQKVNMRKSERWNLRALVHNCTKNGIVAEAAKTGMTDLNFIRKYGGRLNWFAQLNPDQGKAMKDEFLSMARPLMNQYPDVEIDKLSWSSTLENNEWEYDTSDTSEAPEISSSVTETDTTTVLDVPDVTELPVPF